MTLEEHLRAACAKGLTHVTLYPVPSEDNKTIYWAARATPSTGHSYVQTTSLDPVEAMTEVLKALPSAKKRAVTATVKGAAPDRGTTIASSPTETPQELDAWLPRA